MKPINLRHLSAARAQATSAHAASASAKTVKLPVKRVSPESFRPFGQVTRRLFAYFAAALAAHSQATLLTHALWTQVISATPDGKGFDEEDAQLQLNKGQPR